MQVAFACAEERRPDDAAVFTVVARKSRREITKYVPGHLIVRRRRPISRTRIRGGPKVCSQGGTPYRRPDKHRLQVRARKKLSVFRTLRASMDCNARHVDS